jgi:hypothetical protein
MKIAILEAMAHGFSINGDELASQFGTKGRNVGDEEHLSEIVSFGSFIAGIGESFERFHARRKSPGVLLIASLLVGHLAPVIHMIVSYKP